jgi:hypothetical protein
MNAALNDVRSAEARRLARGGYEAILKLGQKNLWTTSGPGSLPSA